MLHPDYPSAFTTLGFPAQLTPDRTPSNLPPQLEHPRQRPHRQRRSRPLRKHSPTRILEIRWLDHGFADGRSQ
ncbi:MAG: hypothetical protein MUF49_15705 [Oculatellaceae cyanobacterium Prado106]|nr:hypothetical protein [Oculatellaceae cyanobacterium Prado106]